MGLLAVPGAAAGGAEPGHDGGEFGEGGAGILGTRTFFDTARFGFFDGAGSFFWWHARVFS